MKHSLIIVGGGAAGLTAAITAKDYGLDVAIIEGNDRIGKKILTTGNGRCNITNNTIDSILEEYCSLDSSSKESFPLPYHSNNKDFFLPVLKEFTVKDTINFFYSLGLPLTTLDNGKMYPLSLQASSVLDILKMAVEEKEIPVYLSHRATSIKPFKEGFKITTKQGDEENHFQCQKLIICTGGKAAPNTGSDGFGYKLAEALGHSMIEPIPALVQLKLDYKNIKALSGIKFEGTAEIVVDGDVLRKESGEILFTDYGISGPPILQLSSIASYTLSKKNAAKIKVNMLPNMSKEELDNFIETHKALFGHRPLMNAFIGTINKKIIPIVLKEAGIDNIHKPLSELSWKEKTTLMKLLQEWEFIVSGTNSFSNSQVTAGGINTKEIDPNTLKSNLHDNLYFAGEILDVNGDCGGYNLQWAWSSGYMAVKNCCQ